MNKDVKKILLVLVLYAFSGGIFYNFIELWMAENNLSINTISTVLSLCAVITCSVIFLSSNLLKPNKLKSFIITLLIIKIVIITALFFLYKSNLNIIIKFLIMVDYAADTEIFASIYPLISLIVKEDNLYAIRGLAYDLFYYVGVILVALLLGKQIFNVTITYNSYLLVADIFLLIGLIVLVFVDMKKYYKSEDNHKSNDLLFQLLGEIKHDKISIYYLTFIFFGNAAYYTITGMLLTIMVKELGIDPALASNIRVVLGISSALLGIIILSKLTLKNNYINIGIKYIGRAITYFIAFTFTNKITLAIAIVYTILTSSTYTHVTDAPYINRFDDDKQLSFANLKEMLSYLSRGIGTFLCGLALINGIRMNFIISFVLVIFSTIFSYLTLYNYNKEKVILNDRK